MSTSQNPTPGTRVGAVAYVTPQEVLLLGYGVYLGNEVPSEDARGLGGEARVLKMPNPKIQLDSGEVVWGVECWWGHEAEVKKMIETYVSLGAHLIERSVTDLRAELPPPVSKFGADALNYRRAYEDM